MSGGNNSNVSSSSSESGPDPFSVQPAVEKIQEIQGFSTKMFFSSSSIKPKLRPRKQHLLPEHHTSSSEHHGLSDDSYDDPPYPGHGKPLESSSSSGSKRVATKGRLSRGTNIRGTRSKSRATLHQAPSESPREPPKKRGRPRSKGSNIRSSTRATQPREPVSRGRRAMRGVPQRSISSPASTSREIGAPTRDTSQPSTSSGVGLGRNLSSDHPLPGRFMSSHHVSSSGDSDSSRVSTRSQGLAKGSVLLVPSPDMFATSSPSEYGPSECSSTSMVGDSGSESSNRGHPPTRGAKRGGRRSQYQRGSGRKHQADKRKWDRVIQREAKRRGQAHRNSKTGKTMPAAKMGPDCMCKQKCFERVGEEERQHTFSRYWALLTDEAKIAYMAGQITNRPIKRRRQKDVSKQRVAQYYYKIQIQLNEWNVCRKAFAAIHGVSVYHVEIVINSKATGEPIIDKRGSGPSANAYSREQVDRVHQQIQSLAVTASHYTREHTPNRQYLEDPGINIILFLLIM